MKYLIALFLLGFTQITFSQNEDEIIQNIREKYKDTRAAYPNFSKDKRELMNFQTTEGGEVTACADTSGIRLIEVVYMGEMGKKTFEYYYHKGKLYFVFEQNYTYNAPIYYDEKMAKESGGEAFDLKKATIEANRYYFSKGKLIRWLGPRKEKLDVKSTEGKEKSKEVLQNSGLFWETMNK